MKRIPLLIAATSLAALSSAQRISLKLNLPLGKSFAYAITTKMKSEGGMAAANGSVTQQMTVTNKPLSKNAQGTRIQMKVTGVKITGDTKGLMAQQMSQAAKQMEGSVSEAVYDARGQVVTAAVGARIASMGGMGAGFMGVIFPTTSVSPGAKWSSTVDFQKIFSSMGQGMVQTGAKKSVPIHFKLLGVKRIGAKTLATMSYQMKGDLDLAVGGGAQGQAMPMKVAVDMKGRFVVDAANGMPREGKSGGTTKIGISGMTIMQTIDTTYRLK